MQAVFDALERERALPPNEWYKHINYTSLACGIAFLAMNFYADFKDYGKTFAALTPGLIFTAGSLTPLIDKVSKSAAEKILTLQVTMMGVASLASGYGYYKGYYSKT